MIILTITHSTQNAATSTICTVLVCVCTTPPMLFVIIVFGVACLIMAVTMAEFTKQVTVLETRHFTHLHVLTSDLVVDM